MIFFQFMTFTLLIIGPIVGIMVAVIRGIPKDTIVEFDISKLHRDGINAYVGATVYYPFYMTFDDGNDIKEGQFSLSRFDITTLENCNVSFNRTFYQYLDKPIPRYTLTINKVLDNASYVLYDPSTNYDNQSIEIYNNLISLIENTFNNSIEELSNGHFYYI